MEEKRLKVEKKCTELAIQLEKAREEVEKKILEIEVEKLVLSREERLKYGLKEGFEENIDGMIKSPLLANADGRGSPVSIRNPQSDQNFASQMVCTWNGGVQLEQSPHSRQDAASQTDLFASELEGLKKAMADDSLETKHFFAIEEDDCSLDIPLEEKEEKVREAQEEVYCLNDDRLVSAPAQDEEVGETETSLEEELRSSFLQEGGLKLESKQGGDGCQQLQELTRLGWPFCGKSSFRGVEMLVQDEDSDSSLEREAGIRKPNSMDCAVNTEERELPKKNFAGFVKSLLAWLLLILSLFTTFGAVRVDHKVHFPSTWLLLYQLFGSSLPLPFISVAFDSNPRPHIN